ncbi:DUF1349 domain-containing protein [Arcticibacter sp.]|jgi:regulation of enolase protein 1 (concanavalin A-like superfamily)|uniref:DUF1349 domain-containing protein n=1 Tax=Arcticibacter sp. TaxID=1872630 RepID=UPI00388F228C
MRSKFYPLLTLATLYFSASCTNSNNQSFTQVTSSDEIRQDSALAKGSPCDIKLPGIHFTRSINGADSLATVDTKGNVIFRVGEKKDYFNDPNNKLSNNTAPILLSKVDNSQPFTLIAKVTPEFTKEGMYDAGVLYIYVNDSHWQKFCYEQDERGNHRVVTVRTIGTSDDNNHDVVSGGSVYMKISSDTRTVGFYFSVDKKTWNLARLYKNDYPSEIWMGLSAQCPVAKGGLSNFGEVSLEQSSVKDFRLGI